MDPTPDSYVPAPTPLIPPVDRTEQQEQPARTRFFTFAVIGGGIACSLFLTAFLTSLRAQTPHPQSNLKLTPITAPAEVVATPRPRVFTTPEPIEAATSSSVEVVTPVETPTTEDTTQLDASPLVNPELSP